MRKLAILGALVFLSASATATIGTFDISPSKYNFSIAAGSEHQEELDIEWNGKTGANITLVTTAQAEDTNTKGLNITMTKSSFKNVDDGETLETTVKVDTPVYLKPDNFSIMTYAEALGSTQGTEVTSEAGKNGTTISAGSANIAVKPNSSAKVTVKEILEISVSSPPGQTFRGGVDVQISNSSGEVPASGSVTLNYGTDALDDDDVDVYYYNESLPVGERWQNIGGEMNIAQNTVTAEVEHFSTYAAYGRDAPPPEGADSTDGEDDDTVSTGGGGTSDQETQETETSNNTTDQQEQETQTQESQNQTQNEQPENDTAEQEQPVEEEQEPDTQTSSQLTTGQFISEPTNIGLGALTLLLAVLGALQYTGRIDIREKLEN